MNPLWLPVAISAIVVVRPQLVARSASGDVLSGEDDDRGLLRMVRAAAALACLTLFAILIFKF